MSYSKTTMTMRRPKYKLAQVMSWQDRGYARFGVIVGRFPLSKRTAYTLVITDAYGAYEGNNTVVHKWAHQMKPVLTVHGNPRRRTTTVTLWKEGKIG